MDFDFFTSPGRIVFDASGRLAHFDEQAALLTGLKGSDLGACFSETLDRLLPNLMGENFRDFCRNQSAVARILPTASGMAVLATASPMGPIRGRFCGVMVLLFKLRDNGHRSTAQPLEDRIAIFREAASRFSHELKNPIASAILYAQELEESLSENPRLADLSKRMVSAVTGARSVLGNLLLFTLPRNRVGFSPVDLRVLVASAWKLLEIEAKKQGNIRYRCDGVKPVWVNGNKQMLHQAILNLLKNALEATMPHGGEISVSLTTKPDPPPEFMRCNGGQTETSGMEIWNSGAKQSGNLRLLIADTGIGMDENELARMFDPYFTTKTNGRGIGLVICHNIIRLHGGEITVSSRKNRGTEICVELPPLEEGEIFQLSAAERSGSPDIPSVRSETKK